MDMDLARRFAALTARKRELNDQLQEVRDAIADLEPSLMNEMIEAQVDSLPITANGEKITLYFHRVLWAKAKNGDKRKVATTLKRCGMSDLVQENYNTSTLSAYVRERLANGQKLQPTLERVLDLDEVISIRGRRSPASSDSKTAQAMKTLKSTR